MRQGRRTPAFLSWIECLEAWLDRRTADMLAAVSVFSGLKIMDDPEAVFQMGWLFCDVGEQERGLDYLRRAVEKGYFVAPTLSGRPQFDALRGDPAFREVLARALAGREQALAAFREAGGERVLRGGTTLRCERCPGPRPRRPSP